MLWHSSMIEKTQQKQTNLCLGFGDGANDKDRVADWLCFIHRFRRTIVSVCCASSGAILHHDFSFKLHLCQAGNWALDIQWFICNWATQRIPHPSHKPKPTAQLAIALMSAHEAIYRPLHERTIGLLDWLLRTRRVRFLVYALKKMNTMNNSEFLSITDENEMPSTGTTYGTGRTVAPNGEFDNLQLIFDCDTDDNNKPRSGCSVATNTQAQPPNGNGFHVSHSKCNHFVHFSIVELSLHSSYVESNQYEQLPICQSYSDIDESIDIRSPKRSKFLSWFSKRFILPQIDGSPVQASLQSEALWSLNYREAAIYLEEGYNNDKFDYHPQTFVKLPAYLAVHNHLYYVIDLFACLLVLSLALFEKPARDGFHLSESVMIGNKLHIMERLICTFPRFMLQWNCLVWQLLVRYFGSNITGWARGTLCAINGLWSNRLC